MRAGLIIVWFVAALASRAHAECEPKVVEELRQRGADDKLITQICDIESTGPSVLPVSSVCVTNFGVCPLQGKPIDTPCTCEGPMGSVTGKAR